MRVSTLSGWHIQNACPDRQRENFLQSRYFASIAFGSKERLVLEEIVGVER